MNIIKFKYSNHHKRHEMAIDGSAFRKNGERRNTAEERRKESRKQIMNAAMELFYAKGYDNTTTRDIVKKAGILNGSLYNRFKSKEDILAAIVYRMIKDALDEAEYVYLKNKNPVVAAMLPCALEIYASSRNRRIADMLYHAHMSWEATSSYVSLWVDWSKIHLGDYMVDDTPSDEFLMKPLALIGAAGNVTGFYANGGDVDFRESLTMLVSLTAGMFHAPLFDLNSIVDDIVETMKTESITICGCKLDDEVLTCVERRRRKPKNMDYTMV